ncbi:uncharacterized protein LOC123306449 isoform X2 [Coccinella septempunctata]|nr:uncharacterized protein LOC123306449 isoform X2 [Coccinella septempunctata]
MLVLCLLMFALIFARDNVGGTQLTYIVRKEGQRLFPICVGEGEDRYEGIGWTYPLTRDGVLPKEEHYYLPTIKNDYNCKFSNNEHCSKVWAMKNWEIDTNTTRRFDFISDERWQDFPIYYVSNSTKDFKEKIEIPKIFKLGFSVRASEEIELLVCEGWNPKQYSCYHFNITTKEIQTSKRTTMSENDIANGQVLESYKAFSNIISRDEWRNFEIGMDGDKQLKLKDMNLNRTLIEKKDDYPLKPAYLFFKSKGPSLWKIHQNEFFYTRTSQISRLGPSLKLNSNDLCVNLYVSSCDNCTTMFFMIQNGTKTVIDQKELRKSGEWSLIRLSKENVASDYVSLFIQTSYKDKVERKNGFWAIDDIRVCHKNEVKINSLQSLQDLKQGDTEVSCQILEKPNLRPTKKILDSIEEFPAIESESDSKSINLTWNRETKDGLDYFISYQANDICTDHPLPTKRAKSNGFMVTKSNVLSLKDLVPYTTYNVSFSSMLHLEKKFVTVSTKESSYIGLEELPKSVRVEDVTETTARVSWNEVDCEDIRGRIIYTLELTDEKTKKATDFGPQSETSRVLTGLRPYTDYTLVIATSRGVAKSVKKNGNLATTMFFRTKPGLAPPPKNLEVYATSTSTISLRYNLPDQSTGHPVEVHVTRCNPLTLKKCKTLLLPVTPCKLFVGKYCLNIENMIPNQRQVLKISLKNEGSHTFGKESITEAYTEERVPGQPTNITYRIVDCSVTFEFCNLNISWLHPYDQNGTIQGFNIVLNSTDLTGSNESFNEEMKISDKNYSPRYTYQIRKIPYSKKYNLYIRSLNEQYQSQFTTLTVVQTADLGDQIDQTPTLVKTLEDSVEFELKPTDRRLSTTITVIVQDFDESKEIDEKIAEQEKLADNLCIENGETWISQIVKISEETKKLTVGKTDPSGKPLKAATEYCITFLVENVYKNSTHMNVYREKLTTPPHTEIQPPQSASSGPHLFIIVIIVIIVLIVIGFLIVWFFRRSKTSRKPRTNNLNSEEHAYESLPFEDTIANNNMYDHLEHK